MLLLHRTHNFHIIITHKNLINFLLPHGRISNLNFMRTHFNFRTTAWRENNGLCQWCATNTGLSLVHSFPWFVKGIKLFYGAPCLLVMGYVSFKINIQLFCYDMVWYFRTGKSALKITLFVVNNSCDPAAAKHSNPDVFFHKERKFEAVPVAISRPHGHIPRSNQRPLLHTTKPPQNNSELLIDDHQFGI